MGYFLKMFPLLFGLEPDFSTSHFDKVLMATHHPAQYWLRSYLSIIFRTNASPLGSGSMNKIFDLHLAPRREQNYGNNNTIKSYTNE